MTFLDNGRMFSSSQIWTKGFILNKNKKTASKYITKTIDGMEYLFREWKSGDYTIRHMKPQYYVLKRGAYLGDGTDIIKDNINLPFVNDTDVLGNWQSVDFVETPEAFNPHKKFVRDELFLKELVFLPNGKSLDGWQTWTKGVVIHRNNKTASRYTIKDIAGGKYMFFEWKSGDYTIRHRKPQYYVLKKISGIRTDKINLPFKDDPQVIGAWESVDFVESPEKFSPSEKAWAGDLYLKGITFRAGGKGGEPWWTWTKGVVMHSGDKTASGYAIKEISGHKYMFFEWKSGDYVFRGVKPYYYVLRKK
jgi:bla regulator protein BlaR1